jgi:hypothetical protein
VSVRRDIASADAIIIAAQIIIDIYHFCLSFTIIDIIELAFACPPTR